MQTLAKLLFSGGSDGEGLFYINASYSFQGEANPQGLNYNCQLCNIALGAVRALASGCFFGFGWQASKKRLFCVRGVGKTKSLFLLACRGGKTTAVRVGKTAGALGSVGRAGANTSAKQTAFFIWIGICITPKTTD